jgi:uncharacterized protein
MEVHLKSRSLLLFAVIFAVAALSSAPAQTEKKIQLPARHGYVNDLVGMMSDSEATILNKKLAGFEAETSHPIVVLVVPSLAGEDIENFSLRAAKEWRVGLVGLDNGILVTLAMKERQIRVQFGLIMEKYISADEGTAIVKDKMVPPFREKNYFAGFDAGTSALMAAARKYVVPPDKKNSAK